MSLSEPNIDCDNNHVWRIIVAMYVCIIYPAFVAPWLPRAMYTRNSHAPPCIYLPCTPLFTCIPCILVY